MFGFAKDLVSDVSDFGKELIGSEEVSDDQIYDVEAGKKKSELEADNEEEEDGEFTMPGGDYRIQIHIMEAKDLVPPTGAGMSLLSNKEGAADPLVEVECMGKKKHTKNMEGTINPIFNETLYFQFTNLPASQLENGEIIFHVLDHNSLVTNTKIGSFLIDIPNIHGREGHEAYRKWAPLRNLNGETSQIMGYLKVSISILGGGEKPVRHTADEMVGKKTDMKDNMLMPAMLSQKRKVIVMNLLKGVDYVKMDTIGSTDSYVKVSYAGKKMKSKIIDNTTSPEYNETLTVSVSVPNMSKSLKVEVWDEEVAMGDNKMGGFKMLFKNLQTDFKTPEEILPPRWSQIYGAPPGVEGKYADFMTKYPKRATGYRGRILYQMFAMDEELYESKKNLVDLSHRKEPMLPPEEINYKLRCDLFEGHELPRRSKVQVHITCAKQKVYSKSIKMKNSFAQWNENMEEMELSFPKDPKQIPDIFIFLATDDDAEDRMCFVRLKARKILNPREVDGDPIKLELDEDRSRDKLCDEEFAGFLFLRIGLYSEDYSLPSRRVPFMDQELETYRLRLELYMGRELPPADKSGASDPMIIFRCAGSSCKSSTKFVTLNPNWFESKEMRITIPKQNKGYISYSVSALVYDVDDSGNDLLGIATIPLEGETSHYTSENGEQTNLSMYSPNKEYMLKYPGTKKLEGKISVGFHLIREDLAKNVPLRDIRPDGIQGKLHIGCLGLRNGITSLDMYPLRSVYFVYEVEGNSPDPYQTKKVIIQEGTCNTLESTTIPFKIPLHPKYAPYLTVYAFDNYLGAFGKRCLGCACFPLEGPIYNLLDKMQQAGKVELDVDEDVYVAEEEPKLLIDMDDDMGDMGDMDEGSSIHHRPGEEGKDEELLAGEDAKGVKSFHPERYKGTFAFEEDEAMELTMPTPLGGVVRVKDARDQILLTEKDVKSTMELFAKNYLEKASGASKGGMITEVEAKPGEQEKSKVINMLKKRTILQLKKEKHLKSKPSAEGKADTDDENQDISSLLLFKDKPKSIKEKEHSQLIAQVEPHPEKYGAEGLMDLEALGDGIEDTFVGEEYDKPPEYLFGRDDLEGEYDIKKLPFSQLFIKRGQTRGVKDHFAKSKAIHNVQVIGKYKAMMSMNAFSTTKKDEDRAKNMLHALNPIKVVIRVYVLDGRGLMSKDANGLSDPYVSLKLGKTVINDKKSLREKTNNPDFYTTYQMTASFPGEGVLHVNIMDDDGFGGDDLIGATKIDLENRFYSKEWQSLPKKPIEDRILYSPSTSAPQGSLRLWVDIMTVKDAKVNPMLNITPPAREEFEVRVIVYGAKDIIFKDTLEKCSDLYIKGTLGKDQYETDTHWRCRGVASYNYRWKFPITLPLHPENDEDYGKDILTFSMWDRDILKSNEMISETSISLNTHKMLKKTYYRDDRVKMKKLDERMKPSERFWLTCFHPNEKLPSGEKKPQGKIEVSVEVMPMAKAKQMDNGQGREAPNRYPLLEEPTGRFHFNIFNPWETFKEIIGPDNANKCLFTVCCLLLCYVFVQCFVVIMMIF